MRFNNHLIAKDFGEGKCKIAVEFAPAIYHKDVNDIAPGDLDSSIERTLDDFPDNEVMIQYFILDKDGEYYGNENGIQELFDTKGEAIEYAQKLMSTEKSPKINKEEKDMKSYLTDMIPDAKDIKKELEENEIYKKAMTKNIERINKRIEMYKKDGLSRTCFIADSKYEKDLKDLYISKGYKFEPKGYVGGVYQLSEDICW